MKPVSSSKNCADCSTISRRELISHGVGLIVIAAIAGPLAYAKSFGKGPAVSRSIDWTVTTLPLKVAKDGQTRVAYLLQNRSHRIVVNPGDDADLVVQALRTEAISPESITAVFFSSYKSGSIASFAGADRTPFRNAQIWLSESEFEWNDALCTVLNQENPARRAHEALKTFVDGQNIFPGMKLIEVAGPTHGHSGLAVSTAQGTSIVCGDLFDRVSLRTPSYLRKRFVSPSRAIISRRSVLASVEHDTARLLCDHI